MSDTICVLLCENNSYDSDFAISSGFRFDNEDYLELNRFFSYKFFIKGKFKNITYFPYTENFAGFVNTFVTLKLFFMIGTFGNSLGPSLCA